MKKFFRQIKDWSNANQGLLALIAVIIALINIIPFQQINLSAANSFLETLFALLTYWVRVPVYMLLVILMGTSIFASYIARRKPKSEPFAGKILVGTWKNDWGVGRSAGVEVAHITEDGKYIVNNLHVFNIHDFAYDRAKREIRFVKVGVGNDYRRLLNILTVESDQLLVGNEINHPIRYSKLP